MKKLQKKSFNMTTLFFIAVYSALDATNSLKRDNLLLIL